jgi:hypothetical protein
VEVDPYDLGHDFSKWLPTIQLYLVRIADLWSYPQRRPRDPGVRFFCADMARVADQLGLLAVDIDLGKTVQTSASIEAVATELRNYLERFHTTDVWEWESAGDERKYTDHRARCRTDQVDFHRLIEVPASLSRQREYPACDHLAWVGLKLMEQRWGLKSLWPEPGVWSTWFESSRHRH